jgi:hypothetical protein
MDRSTTSLTQSTSDVPEHPICKGLAQDLLSFFLISGFLSMFERNNEICRHLATFVHYSEKGSGSNYMKQKASWPVIVGQDFCM